MNKITALAVLTFKEGIRDRALAGIFIIALIMLFATILFTGLFGHELGKVLVDLNLSTIAFAGLLLTFFVNINLMAKDIDKRTIYCVLSKPISRTQYILGKYLGLMLIVFVALFFLLVFSAGIMYFVKSLYANIYFKDFSWSCYFQAYLYEMLMFAVLNSVVIFFSSISSSSFLTLLFSLATYITGQTIEEVMEFFKKETLGKQMSEMNQWIVDIAQYVFPNFSAFDIKTLASHGKLMPFSHTAALLSYSVVYTILLLFLASLIFNKREIN
ncbi:MAG: ABC transporter permease subunit [Deltaproteobacteria bacterium]|nr:ABC transporter permease subunit [Deltaproteobacteria bacterium]